jgi:hypothetical protein
VGAITLRDDEPGQLWTEIQRWRKELSVLLGVPLQRAGGIVVT